MLFGPTEVTAEAHLLALVDDLITENDQQELLDRLFQRVDDSRRERLARVHTTYFGAQSAAGRQNLH